MNEQAEVLGTILAAKDVLPRMCELELLALAQMCAAEVAHRHNLCTLQAWYEMSRNLPFPNEVPPPLSEWGADGGA